MLHSFPFILRSCPFMFGRYVSKYIGLRKLICPNHLKPVRWVSAQTLTFFFHISLSFLLSFSYRFGGLCRLPSLGFMNMYMYISWLLFFYSYHFLGRQCVGSVNVLPGVIILSQLLFCVVRPTNGHGDLAWSTPSPRNCHRYWSEAVGFLDGNVILSDGNEKSWNESMICYQVVPGTRRSGSFKNRK